MGFIKSFCTFIFTFFQIVYAIQKSSSENNKFVSMLCQAMDLKKLQTPLEEFYNSTMNSASHSRLVGIQDGENDPCNLNLPPKSRSPSRFHSRRFSAMVDAVKTASPGTKSHTKNASNASGVHIRALQEIQPPQLSAWKEPDAGEGSFSQRYNVMLLDPCVSLQCFLVQKLFSIL